MNLTNNDPLPKNVPVRTLLGYADPLQVQMRKSPAELTTSHGNAINIRWKWQPGRCNGPTAPWSIADFKSSPLSAKLVPMKAGCPRGTSALSLLNQGARPGAISSTHPQETLTEGVMLTMAKNKVFKHKLCCLSAHSSSALVKGAHQTRVHFFRDAQKWNLQRLLIQHHLFAVNHLLWKWTTNYICFPYSNFTLQHDKHLANFA